MSVVSSEQATKEMLSMCHHLPPCPLPLLILIDDDDVGNVNRKDFEAPLLPLPLLLTYNTDIPS